MQKLFIALLLIGSLGQPAFGQEPKPTVPENTPATPPPPQASPMRAQCEAELAKDATWMAELKQSIRPEVHKEDAEQMLNNRKHVVAAYAVLWGLTVLFVLLMWMRQKRLAADMKRLEEDLFAATQGTKKGG
jgi:hypothetical protein